MCALFVVHTNTQEQKEHRLLINRAALHTGDIFIAYYCTCFCHSQYKHILFQMAKVITKANTYVCFLLHLVKNK